MPKPSLEPFRVVKIDDFSLLWHCHTTNRSWDRNRFWHPWIFTHFRQDLLCTLYFTVEGFKKALWEAQFYQYDFQKSIFSPCGMTGYEHNLGRSETNLDVFYPILNLFFALEVQNHPNPKTDIRFPSTRILRAFEFVMTQLKILIFEGLFGG